MTKKIFAMFLAVLMVVSMLPTSVFAAEEATCPGEGNVHTMENCKDYTEVYVKAPNCGERGYTTYKCNKCDNETFVGNWTNPVGEHDWKEAEDKAPTCGGEGSTGGKECKVCGKAVDTTPVEPLFKPGTPCEYTDWAPAEINCTTGGKQTRTCKTCGHVEERDVPKSASGHKLEENWTLVTPATATSTGLAQKKCTNAFCNYIKTETIFFAHDHVENLTLLPVLKVAEKCTEAGIEAHWECRVCGKLFEQNRNDKGELVETTLEKLAIKSLHEDIKADLNCKTTTYPCSVCKEVIKVDAANAHTYGKWNIVVAAQCTTDGFRSRTCTVCHHDTQTEIIPALGHIVRTVTVPATCQSYGYTFTHCVRSNCNILANETAKTVKVTETKSVTFALNVGFATLGEPLVNKAFVLGLGELYFSGKTEKEVDAEAGKDFNLATTDKFEEAVSIMLEAAKKDGEDVEGAYWMFFLKNGEKTYISIATNEDKEIFITLSTTAPTTNWAWNETAVALTTTIEEVEYAIALNEKVLTATKLEAGVDAADMIVTNGNGVKLLTFTDYIAAGFDSSKHDWKVLTEVKATCLADGFKIEYCADGCGVANRTTNYSKADAEHDFQVVTQKADCLNPGKKTSTCKVCGHKVEETLPALGHTPVKYAADVKENGVVVHKKGDVIVSTFEGNHMELTAYDYNVCATCGVQFNKHNYRAWAGANKNWEANAEKTGYELANAAHNGKLEADYTFYFEGDCDTQGYYLYKCTECQKQVRVNEANTGKHSDPVRFKATCNTEGGFYTYMCAHGCGTKIGDKEVGTWNKTADKLTHEWETPEGYEPTDHENPVYNNVYRVCKNCKLEETDMVKKQEIVLQDKENLCVNYIYEYYYCAQCDEHHLRGFISQLGHDNKEMNKVGATCTTEGSYDLVCSICGHTENKKIPVKAHKNAAGEEFYAQCNDNTADRHCVVCCDHKEQANHNCVTFKDGQIKEYCTDCYYPAENHDYGAWEYFDSVCGLNAYKSRICSVCYETEAVELEKFNDKVINDLTHRPVVAGAEEYAAYKYEMFDYVYYTYNTTEAKWEREVDSYKAKFLAYTEAELDKTGYMKFECADCGEIIEVTIPALNSIQFEAVIREGEYTYGSLVAVDIFVNGLDKEMYAFNFDVDFTGMVFVGFEKDVNADFVVQVTKPATVKEGKDLIVFGNAAGIKIENVAINGETLLTTLYFRVAEDGAKITVDLKENGTNPTATGAEVVEGKVTTAPIVAGLKDCEAQTRVYLDVNKDGVFSLHDIINGIAILNLEIPEVLYDVTMDIDQDGEFTVYDLQLCYSYYLGDVEVDDLVMENLTEDEAILMGFLSVCNKCAAVYADTHECPEK